MLPFSQSVGNGKKKSFKTWIQARDPSLFHLRRKNAAGVQVRITGDNAAKHFS
jgi:hypothetical protein